MTKPILDMTCGGRMMWFQPDNPDVIFCDKRYEEAPCKLRPSFSVKPDIVADFTNLPFEDNTFSLVVFDPPHLKTLGETSYMCQKYGKLYDDWECVLAEGFKEGWRVLAENGTLIFKWNEGEIPLSKVLSLFKEKPLFGHTGGTHGKTKWCVFFKPKAARKMEKED
jgi:SAM-dependent methyltransferase